VTFWVTLLFLMVLGFGYSFFWTASTMIYLLMRRKVDDTDIDEVYLEEEPGSDPYAGPPPATLPMAPPPPPGPVLVDLNVRSAARAPDWNVRQFGLPCWADHPEVHRALAETDSCAARLDLLARHDLQVTVLATHRVGHAVSSPIDARMQPLLPDYVWGDGQPD